MTRSDRIDRHYRTVRFHLPNHKTR